MIKKTILILIIFLSQLIPIVYSSDNKDDFSANEKVYMLNLARKALYWYLKDGAIPEVAEAKLTDNLKAKKACFITLEGRGGTLRGCMGMFEPVNTPLYYNIINRTIESATKDHRFISNPVKYEELKDIKIKISILTKPKKLKFKNGKDLISKLKPLEDGVILSTPYGNSTYLPQVWEQLPNPNEFLSRLCIKHGAPPSYWKINPNKTNIQTYQAIVFGEEIYGNKVVGKKGAVVGKKGAFVIGAAELLPEGLYLGGGIVKEGTELAPGAIVTVDSDIIEK